MCTLAEQILIGVFWNGEFIFRSFLAIGLPWDLPGTHPRWREGINVIWSAIVKLSGRGHPAFSGPAVRPTVKSEMTFRIFQIFVEFAFFSAEMFYRDILNFEMFPSQNNQNWIISKVFHTKNPTFNSLKLF